MAETVSVQVKGLRELGVQLQSIERDMRVKVARSAVNAGGQVIKRLAKAKAPVSTDSNLSPEVPPGYLRDSIIVRRQRKPRAGLTAEYAVTVRHKGAKANKRKDGVNPYQIGIFNEFGTVKISARPFMRPAFEQGKQEALAAIIKKLRDRIAKANRTVRK